MTQPPGIATPLHRHTHEAEAFLLLEGAMTYRAGEETHELGDGWFMYLPRGIPHAFRIRGDRPARFLAITVPGGLLDLYDEVGVPAGELRLPPPARAARWPRRSAAGTRSARATAWRWWGRRSPSERVGARAPPRARTMRSKVSAAWARVRPVGDDILLRARGLTKRFGDFTAVDGIDVEVRPGRGLRLPRPQRRRQVLDDADDRLRLAGHRGRAAASWAWTRHPTGRRSGPGSASCPQRDILDDELTVEENLWVYGRYFGLSRHEVRVRADELLEFAQLTERRHDRVEPLSGGMKRRLTIARSLINDPEVLLLDEPTTGLDPQARHVLWDRLFRLKREGVTLIVTTHYMDEAEQLCDRLVVMDHGRIVAEGSPRALIAEHSTREVLELRFDPDEQDRHVDAVTGVGERLEVLPDRLLVYADDGDAALATVHARGVEPLSSLVRRSTLEDVFLHLTGRSLVD